MNKLLLIFLIATIFAPILSHSCPSGDLLYIINRGTGFFLGVDENRRVLGGIKEIPLDLDENIENNELEEKENEGPFKNEDEIIQKYDEKEFNEQENSELNENDRKVFLGNHNDENDDQKLAEENKDEISHEYDEKDFDEQDNNSELKENDCKEDDDEESDDDDKKSSKGHEGFKGLRVGPNKKIVLNYLYQKWCLNDVRRTFYNNFNPAEKYAKKTNIVFNNARGKKIVEVKNGNLRRKIIELIPKDQASFYGNWRITYLPKSGMFSIRTLIKNRLGLALSAVSRNPADGVTLKAFRPRDPLQQWIIQA